jgi:hypothetical protein
VPLPVSPTAAKSVRRMLALLASMAILAGVGSTHNVGEQSPAFTATADSRYRFAQGEAWFTTAHKIETGDGWASRLGADLWSGPLSLGASWAHRETSLWRKDRLFVRASVQHGPLRLLAEVAPTSPQMEAKAEARLRLQSRWAIVEPRAWIEWHTAALIGFGKESNQ